MSVLKDLKKRAQINIDDDTLKNINRSASPIGYTDALLDQAGLGRPLETALFGGPGGDGTEYAQQEAMKSEIEALRQLAEEYASQTPEQYSVQGQLSPELLQDSQLAGVVTDPRFSQAELDALSLLEQMSDEGLTARDYAELNRIQGSANRNLQGQMGAIQQNMAARGISGSGLDLVSQQQAAQSAAQRQALADLEVAAMGQDRRRQATMNMGQLGSQLSQQEWNRRAQQAAAQDAINRFNASNRNQANIYNQNAAQNIANMNVGSANAQREAAFQARTGAGQLGYNRIADEANRRMMKEQQEQAARQAKIGAIGGLAGAGVGSYFGPAGAQAGQGVGTQAGTLFAAHGGRVPGETNGVDSYEDDTVQVMVQPGEIIVPETIAQSPEETAAFVAEINMSGPEGDIPNRNPVGGDDIVAAFIKTVDSLSKRGK